MSYLKKHNLTLSNKILDSRHKELFDIIDWMPHLIDVEDVATLVQAFEVLMDRLRLCFNVEEKIALAVDFDFNRHNIIHQNLLDEYMRTEDELMAKYDALPKSEAKKYIDSLRNSLVQHIRMDGEPLKLVLGTYSYDFNPIL